MYGEGLNVGFWARSSPPPFQFHLDRRSSQTGGSVYVYPCACTAAVVVVFAIVAGIVHLPVGGSCALPLGVQCRDRSCGSMCSTSSPSNDLLWEGNSLLVVTVWLLLRAVGESCADERRVLGKWRSF